MLQIYYHQSGFVEKTRYQIFNHASWGRKRQNNKLKSFLKKVLTNTKVRYIMKYVVKLIHTCVGVAQLDRAFGYGPKGREFESSRPRL